MKSASELLFEALGTKALKKLDELEKKKPIELDDIEDLEVDGVDTKDYPDFCDAFFCHAIWKETGEELTDDELQTLAEEYPELLSEMAFEKYI